MGGELRQIQQFVIGFDVSTASEDSLIEVLAEVRRTQRCLDGLVARIGERAEALATSGVGQLADDLLRGAGTVSRRQAAREHKRAALLSTTPELALALSSGAISGDHVDALVSLLADFGPTHQVPDATTAQLADLASRLPVESFRRSARRLLATATPDTSASSDERRRAASTFRHWFDHEAGMGRFSGALDPERYEALIGAVERRAGDLAAKSPDPVSRDAALAADALVSLAVGAGNPGAQRPEAAITVVVHHDLSETSPLGEFQQTENGHDLSTDAVSRLACDAILRRVTIDDRGVPIDVGRRHRTATDAQWAALKAIHHSCAWDACDAPVSWCQAHHIRPWSQGGPTDLDNLVPLCSRHHHAVHEGGWSIKLLPDRTLEVFRPDGRHAASVPTPQRC